MHRLGSRQSMLLTPQHNAPNVPHLRSFPEDGRVHCLQQRGLLFDMVGNGRVVGSKNEEGAVSKRGSPFLSVPDRSAGPKYAQFKDHFRVM